MGVERRLHERSLGIAARILRTTTLVFVGDQSASTVGLRGGSQFDANKSAIAKRANRSMLAHAKPVPYEPPSLSRDSAKLVQIPQPARDFVDRADDDAGRASVNFVAERSTQPASG
ncbi:hypothetical protein [Crateriforma spongiae]|uniref:hypothetical protein n=1 Tax=Crateriforma spongiae TaxID=2724528 RepID=UPI0039AFF027